MRHIGLDYSDERQVRNTQIKLKNLVEQKHIDRIDRGQTGVKGRLKPAYRLLTSGLAYATSQGMKVVLHDKPTDGHLNHVLAINDVILLGLELARSRDDIELKQIKHDFELKTMQLSLVPDAFLQFVVTKPDNKYSYPLLIEVDRGSESQTVIEKKIEAYLRFTDNFRGGEYRDRFKKMSGTIVWFITGDMKRLLNIRETIEDILTRKNLKRLGQFFYLGRIEEKPANATSDMADALFTSDHFLVPFQGTKRFPLLAGADLPGFPDQRQ
jgi:hypothetical protein